MKTLTHLILTLIVFPSLLSAQVKPVLKNKVDTKSEKVMTPNSAKGMLSKPTENRIYAPASISIKNINQLKEELPMDKLLSFARPEDNTQPTNPGNSVYKTGNGVVLDAANPRDLRTGSVVCLWGVTYNPVIYDQINTKSTFWLRQMLWNRSEIPDNISAVAAYFQDLPTSPHLFMLTIGTDSRPEEITISITIGDDPQGNLITQYISGDKLVRVPGSLETKVLFTSNAINCPSLALDIPEFGDNFSTNYAFLVIVHYKIYPPYDYSYFHHIQLVQLD